MVVSPAPSASAARTALSCPTSRASSRTSSVSAGLAFDLEVGDDLGAERLAEHDHPAHPLVLRCVGLQGRVLEVLRANAGDDRPTDVCL